MSISRKQIRLLLSDCERRYPRWHKYHDDNYPLKQYHYSAIVQHDTIIAAATNRRIKLIDPKLRSDFCVDATVHSEIAAINKARRLLILSDKFDVINIRLSLQTGRILNSTPCCRCAEVLAGHDCRCYYLAPDYEVIRCI